jgi:hypothetical protein
MPRFPLIAALLSLALAACAAEPPQELRLLVKLTRASVDGAEIARLASASAGMPVRYAAPVSERWHAVLLSCPDAQACEAAIGRLRADKAVFEQAERDERKRAQ